MENPIAKAMNYEFKFRPLIVSKVNLKEYDKQQTLMLEQVKEETEYLEQERQKLIDLFKKEKLQLELIEKKIHKLEQTTTSPSSTSISPTSTNLTSTSTSSITQNFKRDENVSLTLPRDKSNSVGNAFHLNTKSHLFHNNHHHHHTNGTITNEGIEIIENKLIHNNGHANKSILSLSNSLVNNNFHTNQSNLSIASTNPIVYKFAELEHTLAVKKAENNAYLEEQVSFNTKIILTFG